MTVESIWIAGLPVLLSRKKMKYLRLTVKPPHGEIRVSVPLRASKKEIVNFVTQQREWISHRQREIAALPKPKALQFVNGESHFVWGFELTLTVQHAFIRQAHCAEDADQLRMLVPQAFPCDKKQTLLNNYYRSCLERAIPAYIKQYELLLKVSVNQWRIRQMKTRWGSCNIDDGRIWLNLELAKYPKLCLQYVVLHEMVHLLEQNHTKRFWRIVSLCMPEWQEAEQLLDSARYSD